MDDENYIDNLPMELKQKILNQLPVKDVNNLRISSRSFSNPSLFKSYIDEKLKYREVEFNFQDTDSVIENIIVKKCELDKIYDFKGYDYDILFKGKMILEDGVFIDGEINIIGMYNFIENNNGLINVGGNNPIKYLFIAKCLFKNNLIQGK